MRTQGQGQGQRLQLHGHVYEACSLQCITWRSRRALIAIGPISRRRVVRRTPGMLRESSSTDEDQQCDDAAFDCEEAGEGGEGQGQGNHWELESERVDVCR